jgi:hypothetical protein
VQWKKRRFGRSAFVSFARRSREVGPWDGVVLEPVKRRNRGGEPKVVVCQARDRPVVDDLPVVVAPGRVQDLTDAAFLRIAHDHAVHQGHGVPTANVVLQQR